ncbi:MAG: non-homologous end joining protein Ku [Pseudobdellovibrio sp.]
MKKKIRKKALKKKKKSSPQAEDEGVSSQRGLWSGSISFGLVNIGVKVVSAREEKELHFSMLDPSNLSPVGYRYYNKNTGEEVKREDTVKAYEYKSGTYVIMTEADFKKANPKATQTIDIENFVDLDQIDPVFFEKAYYLLPKKGNEKAYKLLTEALAKSKKTAIAKMVMHTKQHLVALIPRGNYLLCETLHFANEVKELRDLGAWKDPAVKTAVSIREIEMAEKLIEDMTGKWNPSVYKDTYREDIMKRVRAKVKAGKATEITEDYEELGHEETSNVVDLMPLLRKSLEAKKHKSKTKAGQ